jgi:hypothetical protein
MALGKPVWVTRRITTCDKQNDPSLCVSKWHAAMVRQITSSQTGQISAHQPMDGAVSAVDYSKPFFILSMPSFNITLNPTR